MGCFIYPRVTIKTLSSPCKLFGVDVKNENWHKNVGKLVNFQDFKPYKLIQIKLFRLWEYQKTIPHSQKLLGTYFKSYFDWKIISQLPAYVCILRLFSIHVFYVCILCILCMYSMYVRYVCLLRMYSMYSMHVFYVCI